MRCWLLLLAGLLACLAGGSADAGAPGPRARLFRVGSCGPGGPQCQWECNAPDPRQLPKCGGGTRCAVDPVEAFVAHLVVTVDDSACAAGVSGARVTLGLRGRRSDGTEFSVPDRTFDLCGVDVACAGCDMNLCPEGGVTCPRERVFVCNGDAREGESAFVGEANLAALQTWLGSESGTEPGQLLPPDVEADLRAAFPGATGRPLVVTATEIESERQDHAADASPSVRGFCVKVWWTRAAYDTDVLPLPSVASPSSVARIDCAGPCGDGRVDPAEGCDDGDPGRLDGCDERCRTVCASPRTDCRSTGGGVRSRLMLENRRRDRSDTLHWTFAKDPGTTVADFGDPVADDDYVLCVYDQSGASPTPIVAAVAAAGQGCASPPCWQDFPGRGFVYEDSAGSPHGLKRVRLQAGRSDARIAVKGAGARLALPDFPLSLPLRVQLERKDGTCWEAIYDGASRNDAHRFEAFAGP